MPFFDVIVYIKPGTELNVIEGAVDMHDDQLEIPIFDQSGIVAKDEQTAAAYALCQAKDSPASKLLKNWDRALSRGEVGVAVRPF